MASDGDLRFMQVALEEAQKAFDEGEIPVGAVVVHCEQVVGRGRNAKEHQNDPTAHAEIEAIRQAAQQLGRWRLFGCTLFVTLEPCPMCMGAILSARMDRLVFGCVDPKAGAAVSLFEMTHDSRLNHQLDFEAFVLAEPSRILLKRFFEDKRRKK